MSRQQLVRLGVALAGVLLLWGILAIVRRPPSDVPPTLAWPRIDTAAVDTVTLTQHGDTTRLVRATGGHWLANGYPAASEAITALLRGLADTTGSSEQVAVSSALHGRLGVTADSGTHVRVDSRGRTVLDVVAGRRTTDYGGVYLRRTTEQPVYTVRGTLADGVTRGIGEWRDTHIAAVVPDSVTTIQIRRGGRSAQLRRSAHGWEFASAGGGPADTSAVAALLNQYRDLRANGFAPKAQSDTTRLARAARHMTLGGKGGWPLLALGFDSAANTAFVQADSGGPVFQVGTWMLAQLLPADSALRPKRGKGKTK